MSKPLFRLGKVVATPGALEALDKHEINSFDLIQRHHQGDWGNLEVEDKRRNDAALIDGSRIFSSYEVAPHVKIWIITESDRSSTCLLTPGEY